MYEEYNCLSFFARIKTKTVLESLKDSLKMNGPVFQFPFYYFYNYFCFPYKIARETKTKKIKGKKGPGVCRESFKDSKIVFVFILAQKTRQFYSF